MASTTVIDRFLIELGLDPKNLKKGSREAVAALAALKGEAKDVGDDMSKSVDKGSGSLAMLGRRVLSVAAIFKVLSYTTKNILEASKATYDLANSAKGVDQAARSLRNFENVAEIMGGTAEGARKTIEGMHKAIFNASFNGQISDQLVQLGRLGVSFQDASGHMRDFKDIYLDTAQRIQEAQANGSMTQGEALEFLQSAGFDPGLARAAVGGRDSAAAALARQEARRQVGDSDIANATGNEQALTSANQAKDAAFIKAMGIASPTIQRIAGAKEGLFNAGETGDVAQAWEAVTAALEPLSTGLANATESVGAFSDSVKQWASQFRNKGAGAYNDQINESAKRHGVPADLLNGLLGAESEWNPGAVSPAGAIGIAQFMPGTAADEGFVAGVDPAQDIDHAAKLLARLHGSFVKTGSSDSDAWDKALMSYNGGERRVRTSKIFGDGTGTDLKPETINYPGRVYEHAAAGGFGPNGGGQTSIQIDEVNVNTAATDAQGIASGMSSAIKNKLGAAQAEQGQN